MLIEIGRNDKSKSIYKCDMCGKKITIKEFNKIHVEKPYDINRKFWDLCDDCLKKLVRSINIYSKKNSGK